MHTSTYRLYTSIKIALALMTAGSGSSVADPGHIADAGSDPCSCTDIWHTFYFVQLSKVKMGFQGGIWIRSLWCRSSQIRNPQKQFYTRRNTCQISITGMSRVAAKIFVFVDSPNFRTFFFSCLTKSPSIFAKQEIKIWATFLPLCEKDTIFEFF